MKEKKCSSCLCFTTPVNLCLRRKQSLRIAAPKQPDGSMYEDEASET